MANMISILNTIRYNGTEEYQNRVPVATQNNIASVGNPIITYQTLQNEFCNALVNRIGLTVLRSKIAQNPLAILKKGSVPLGSDIQEIFTNMAEDHGFDGQGSKLLTKTTPDVKALYHRMNRQSQYPITISRQQLERAFTDYANLESLLTQIINSMYSGDNYDEYILMKNTLANAVNNNYITKVSVSHVGSITNNTTALVKAIKNTSSAFTFPSSSFNKYYANKPESDNGKAVTTWTPIENQILIIRADIMNEIDVDVLASAFNLNKVEFLARVLKVDNFGTAENVYAILADESLLEVRDNLFEVTNFFNGQGLYWNYWLNHWQTYSFSMFCNAVAFVCNEETITLSETSKTLSNKTPVTLTATTTPEDATVQWMSTNENVATVENGAVTAIADGTCKIIAFNGDAMATCTVTVALS